MPEESGGGGIIKRTVFQFDFDLSTANKSNEQLVEMQQRLRAEVEKTEKEIQTLLNEMGKMKMSGDLIDPKKKTDFFNLGGEIKRLQDFARSAARVVEEIDVRFKDSAQQADLFADEAKSGMAVVREEAKRTQSAIAQIGKEFDKGTAEAKTFAAAVSRSADRAAADLSELLSVYSFGPITPTKMARGKPAEGQGFQTELFDLGNAVQMGGGTVRMPTYSEEIAQFEQFIRQLVKAEPILVSETQTLREYSVQIDKLTNATVRVVKVLDEFGNIKALKLDQQVLPSLDKFNARALKLQQDGFKFFATIEDGTNVTKLFAKEVDGTVVGVARLSGELDDVTGDLKRVSGGVLDAKADFQKLFEMMTIAGASGTITSFLPEEQFQMMKLFLGQYASEVGAMTKKQERDFREAASVFVQQNQLMIESAEKSESVISSAINKTTATIEAQRGADQDIIDITPVVVESVEKQAAAQNTLQNELQQTQAELEQTQAQIRETTAAGALPPAGGRMTPFGIIPQGGGGGGGRGNRGPGGGGADDGGGRSNPAMEFRDDIMRAYEELQRITNVRDFPGLVALQKELDVLRQRLIMLADDSRMGLVTIETAGQQAEEYVMTAREFTGLWSAINKVALELERADKSFRSFGEMKPGTEAQVFFTELERALKNMEGQFKRGEINATEFYRRVQLVGDAVGTTGKKSDIYASALSRAFKAMQTEKATEFRKALAQINIELLKGGKASEMTARLEAMKKKYADNVVVLERLEKALLKIRAAGEKASLKAFNDSIEENRLEIKEGTSSLQEYLAILETAMAEWKASTSTMPQFGNRLRKEIASVKAEIQTAKWKEFTAELERIQIEFRQAPAAIEPFIQQLNELKAAWAGNDTAARKVDAAILSLQKQFASINLEGFTANIRDIKAQFDLGRISAREWLEQLQLLLPTVESGGRAFTLLASQIRQAQGAADTAAMREYKTSVQELTAQAAAGAITQRQLVMGLEALRPQVEGNAAAMQHLEMAIAKARRGAGDMGMVVNGLGQILKTAKHHAMWMMSGALIMPLYNLPYAMLEIVKKLDTAFAKLKSVLMLDPEVAGNFGMLSQRMKELEDAAFKFGMHYGEDVEQVSEVMFQVAQKYKKSADIIVVSNQVMRLSMLDFTDNAEETATQLMSLIAQFNLAPKEVEDFINKVIVAGAAVRASAGEIMEGLTRSASMFKVVGADANEAIALIAASLEKTGRSAEVVGTSWRNLVGRMAAIEKVKELMEKYGIEVFNNMQTQEDFAQTMDKMKEKYVTMSDEMKATFASTVAGQRQLQTLMPILEDTDKTVEKLRKTVGLAKDDLKNIVDNAVIEQTMTVERRMKSVGVAFQFFWWQLIGNPQVKRAFLMFMMKVIGALQWIQEHFRTLKMWVKLIAEYVAVMKLAALWNMRFGKAAVTAAGEVGMMNAQVATSNKLIPTMGRNIQGLGLKIKALGAEVAMVAKRFFLLWAAGEALKVFMYHFKTDSEKEIERQNLAVPVAERVGDIAVSDEKGEWFGKAWKETALGFDALVSSGFSPDEINKTMDYINEIQGKYGIYPRDFESGKEFADALKKALEQEVYERDSKILQEQLKAFEESTGNTFDKWIEENEAGSSNAMPGMAGGDGVSEYLMDEDKTKGAANAIDTYSSSVDRLKKSIASLTTATEAHDKSLERQVKALKNLIDLAPYEIYSDFALTSMSGDFKDLFNEMDYGFQLNIQSAKALYKKLDDIAALREKIKGQSFSVEKESKTMSAGDIPRTQGEHIKFWRGDYGISSGYGPRRKPKRGASSEHHAYDFLTPNKTDIVTPVSGLVKFAGEGKPYSGYGKTIVLELGKDLEIRLSHLSEVLVGVGDKVDANTLIGRSGSTGVSTGYHTDVGYYVDGKPVKVGAFNEKLADSGFSIDYSDKQEKAVDTMKTQLQELDTMEAELKQKIVDMYAMSDDQFAAYVSELGNLDSAMKGIYGNLTSYQTEYYDWLKSTGQISLEDWANKVTEIHDEAAKTIGDMFGFDPKQVEKAFMADPVQFMEQQGYSIGVFKQELQELRDLYQSGAIPVDEYIAKFDVVNEALINLVKTSNYASLFYVEQVKKMEDANRELRESALRNVDLRIAAEEAFRDKEIENARNYGMVDEVIKGMSDKWEAMRLLQMEKVRLLEVEKELATDINKKQELDNQMAEISAGIARAKTEMLLEQVDILQKQYDQSVMLRDLNYEFMRIGATDEETLALDRMEALDKLNDAYTKLEIAKAKLAEQGFIEESSLMSFDNIQSLVREIAQLNLELYKMSPALEAINKISKEAATNLSNAMRDAIKGFFKGEKSFAEMLKDMAKAQTDAVSDVIASSFAEAIMMKLGGEMGDFEKRMQNLSSAIFKLFGLEAPDKRPVLDKVYDENMKAIRVIMADKSQTPGGILNSMMGALFGGGAGGGIGGLPTGGIIDLVAGGAGGGKGKISVGDMLKNNQKELRKVGYEMAGSMISQIVIDAVAGQEAGLGSQLGGSLGYALGTAGSIFGGLGAAAGPVGMIAGALIGSIADNAFGVGRGERRRQAMAEQRANRQAEIDSMKERYGALGFSEEYVNQMAGQVPDFIERSQRSFMGLSGTSRWLEGGEAVYGEINRQKAMLDAMEKTVKDYNEAVKESNHQLAMGVGRFDKFGKEFNAYAQAWSMVDWEGGRVALRVAGDTFDAYQSNLARLSGAGGAMLSPFINMNNQFNTLTDRIEMMTYWLGEMEKVGLASTDTFRDLQEQLYALQQKKYWADIFQPIKEGEWLQQFGVKTDQDLLQYYKNAVGEAFGYQGEITENVMKDLATMLAPEVGLLQTGQIEGYQAEDTQYRMELLQALWQLTNKINDNNLAQAAVGQRNVGEAISGTAQVVQNYNTFEVNAENYFSTRTEMLNVAREFATMIKQQGWIDPAVFNI